MRAMLAVLCALLALLAIGWVLSVNARDRKRLEKELQQQARDDAGV